MNKKILGCATLVLSNIVWFYAMKNYTDMRQVRVVSACSKSTVELASIGPIIKRIPYVKFKGKEVVEVGYHFKKESFGQVNAGTGVFVSNTGLILTCEHVTRGSRLIQVSLKGFQSDELAPKKVRKLFAYVVGVDKEADLALLRVIYPVQRFRAVKLGKGAEIGLPVFTIGFPDSFEKYVTAGIISNFDFWTYSDTVVYHGSSGGGLFDADGDLVGLADNMRYPNQNVAAYQGFSGFTDLKAMHKLLKKYEAE